VYEELEGAPLRGGRELFDVERIRSHAARGVDPLVLERSLHCMEYVAQLTDAGLDFVFKGGTACQLLLGGGLQRLSIDIDLATRCTGEEVRSALDRVRERVGGRTYGVTSVPKMGLDAVPLAMYNVSAPTHFPGQKADTMIKVDVVLHEPGYPVWSVPLRTFYYESEVMVRTPTPSSMLGDKLTTLGPRTAGLPASRSVDNVKQFYDVGGLLGLEFDPRAVRGAYDACFGEVAAWRDLSISPEDGLRDLEDWCKVATCLPFTTQGAQEMGRGEEVRGLARGVDGFAGYITRANRLTKRRLRDIASRTALLSRLLRGGPGEATLLRFIRDPARYREVVHERFGAVLDGVAGVDPRERWHIHLSEFKNSPLALAAWYGHWDPGGLVDVLGP
jgi:hypothetical protein